MDKVRLIVRILMGLLFFVFGLNGFLNFIPTPPDVPEAAQKLGMAMMESGYMMTMVKGVEVMVGVLLLSGLFVPLALVILAPITVNIVAFHYFLAPSGLGMALAILGMHLLLGHLYRAHFRTVLQMR